MNQFILAMPRLIKQYSTGRCLFALLCVLLCYKIFPHTSTLSISIFLPNTWRQKNLVTHIGYTERWKCHTVSMCKSEWYVYINMNEYMPKRHTWICLEIMCLVMIVYAGFVLHTESWSTIQVFMVGSVLCAYSFLRKWVILVWLVQCMKFPCSGKHVNLKYKKVHLIMPL